MPNMFDLEGRIAIVTGGVGQLGRQYVQTLLEYGAKVAVWDLSSQTASISQTGKADSDHVGFYAVDITQRDEVQAALDQVTVRWGVPHILINNAAIDSPPNAPVEENGPFETYPEESFDKILQVNIKGTLICCQCVGTAMAEAGRGSIINIGSIYGMLSPNQNIYTYRAEQSGQPFFKPVAYSVSKSAIYNLTRYLATYWAAKGVRVNTLTLAGVFNNQDQQFLDNYCALIPIGRMADEREYNGALLFLASDASTYMTGSNLIIDGGWTAW